MPSLNAAAVKAVQPGDLGKMESTASKQTCSLDSCAKTSAVVLAEHTLCLEHYFEWCYQRLEALEVQIHRKPMGVAEDSTLRGLVEECSNRTLAVSLQHEPLTNQDRSRLLDILLWTGDLLYLLRSPQAKLPDSVNFLSSRTRSVLSPRTGRSETR
jgi:hypothetical protein